MERNVQRGVVAPILKCDAASHDTFSTSHQTHFRLGRGAAVIDPVKALELWERTLALPSGEQSRCHTPAYAILLSLDRGEFYLAAICWECGNISLNINGEFDWQTFDTESAAAQQLLQEFKNFAGHPPETDNRQPTTPPNRV